MYSKKPYDTLELAFSIFHFSTHNKATVGIWIKSYPIAPKCTAIAKTFQALDEEEIGADGGRHQNILPGELARSPLPPTKKRKPCI